MLLNVQTHVLLGLGRMLEYFLQRSTVIMPSTVIAAKKKGRCRTRKQGRTTSTIQGIDEGTWQVGCIQKMRRKAGGNSWGSLKHPLDLANREIIPVKKGTPVLNVQLILRYYNQVPGQYKFKYSITDSKWIALESVITNVTMTQNSETQLYSSDRADAQNLNEYVSNNVAD